MADPAHAPAGDSSFRDSLLRNVASAVGLVVLVALVFWALSAIGNGDGVEVANPSETPVATASPDGGPSPTPSASETSSPTPVPTPSATSTPTPTPTVTATAEPPTSNPTIQLIDAVLDDDGAAFNRVKSALRDAGYAIRFETESFRVHDETKIWFTPGNEAAANEIRSALGFGLVEPAPDNMSAAVDVHVVVGRDA